jgi:hypothetical protein
MKAIWAAAYETGYLIATGATPAKAVKAMKAEFARFPDSNAMEWQKLRRGDAYEWEIEGYNPNPKSPKWKWNTFILFRVNFLE